MRTANDLRIMISCEKRSAEAILDFLSVIIKRVINYEKQAKTAFGTVTGFLP